MDAWPIDGGSFSSPASRSVCGRDRLRAAAPGIAEIRRSFRTSSSPGAAAYDVVAGLFLGGYYDDIAADCAATLDGVDSPAILEVGPGPGHLAERLLTLLPDGRWTGLDIDRAMLDTAERRLADAGLEARSTAVEGDVTALPFDDASFDLVVSSLSAHHWSDAAAGFREIRRVLRPGATALVFDVPEAWGHAETGSEGLGAASAAFDRHRAQPDARRGAVDADLAPGAPPARGRLTADA